MKRNIFFLLVVLAFPVYSQNLVSVENFSSCSLPQGWIFKSIVGNYNFNIQENKQMVIPDGRCMVSYDQTDRLDISRRKFQLISPSFKIGGFDRYYVVFDMQYYKPVASSLNLYMNTGSGNVLIRTFPTEFRDYTSVGTVLNIPSTANTVSFTMDYESTVNDFGTKIAIDNFILSPDNNDCNRSITLKSNDACIPGHIAANFSQQPITVSCSGDYSNAVWYKYVADFTGLLEISGTSSYNNVLSVFEGTCNALQAISCTNKDEFGFEGELLELNVNSGKTYYLRFSRKINDFGAETGTHCVSLKPIPNSKPKPAHDLCNDKIVVLVNGTCVQASNLNARTETTLPSLNLRSRADVWYSFVAVSNQVHEIVSKANFAEVISVYKGSCNSLQEVAVEDLGNTLSFTPKAGTEYFVQISGYFATIEGQLCLEVKEKISTKPQNDLCATATAIDLNKICNNILFENNNLSAVKPSCVVYSAPDVWYKFVAPSEKSVALRIDAQFVYHWAVYGGTCSALIERECGQAPDPCNGFIRVADLTPGQTYYLQIIAATHPLKPGEGNLCVRIDELSKTEAFDKLNLNLSLDCLHGVLGKVIYDVQGGSGSYLYTGPDATDIFYPGQKVEAFVEDAKGCRDFASLEVTCKSPSRCKNSSLDIDLLTTCLKDSIGRQTGEVMLSINGKGGSGAYYFYGTANGSTLKHGDVYKIIVIDSDSCYVIEEGKIYCPPFDCSQSALKINLTYDCIDTLLKAKLNVDVSGHLGNYILEGNKSDDLLDQGQSFRVKVMDDAGCSQDLKGTINCNFDSCAYSRPSLNVSYICLRDEFNRTNGKAMLLVDGNSKAGGIKYIGNQPGDTLEHLQNYTVELLDAFGCGLVKSGIVDCVPLSTYESSNDIKLMLQPNPTSGEVILSFYAVGQQNTADLQILNISGQVLKSQKIGIHSGVNHLLVDLVSYNPSLYLIKVGNKDFNGVVKVIKI